MTDADPTALLGSWTFDRLIEDLATGERSSADGSCELTAAGDDLILWHERATLNHGDQVFSASRDLRIERSAGAWHVHFGDGRYFHPWSTTAAVTHPCGEDLYEGLIEVDPTTDPVTTWQITWRVHGPRKDLRISTRLKTLPYLSP
jgi:hypothetical protein